MKLFPPLILLVVLVAVGARPGSSESESEEAEDNVIGERLSPRQLWERLRSMLQQATGLMEQVNNIPEQIVPYVLNRDRMVLIQRELTRLYKEPVATPYGRLIKAARILELRAQLLRTKAQMLVIPHPTDKNLEEALKLLRHPQTPADGSGDGENQVGDE